MNRIKYAKQASYSRYLARKKLGKKLPLFIGKLVIHHIDGNPFNNNSKNLKLMSKSEHSKLHWTLFPWNILMGRLAYVKESNLFDLVDKEIRLWNIFREDYGVNP